MPGCAGSVELSVNEGAGDYKSFGIAGVALVPACMGG
jgi:hypothetical protein